MLKQSAKKFRPPKKQRRPSAKVREYLDFAKAFAKSPLDTGSLAPSSRELAEAMAQPNFLNESSLVVEVGPGTGAITRVILERLPCQARYLGIDLNRNFVNQLSQKFPQSTFYQGSAEALDGLLKDLGLPQADAVISGLPWTLFSVETQKKILGSISRSLTHNGTFATFSYIQSRYLPSGHAFRALLQETFPNVQTSKIIWKNLPPAIVYFCRKKP